MNQGARANEEWADVAMTAEADDVAAAWDAPAPPRRWPIILVGSLLALLAAGWIAALAWGIVQAAPADGLTPLKLAAWIGLGSGPLALLAILYLLLLNRAGPRPMPMRAPRHGCAPTVNRSRACSPC